MDFVNIFACSHPSHLRVFVRFEDSSLPRIWKVSNLVFIFNISFSFTLNKRQKIINWQIAITICSNSYRLQATNRDNYLYILQWIINSVWHCSNNFCKEVLCPQGEKSQLQVYVPQKSEGHVSDENFLYYCTHLASKISSYGVWDIYDKKTHFYLLLKFSIFFDMYLKAWHFQSYFQNGCTQSSEATFAFYCIKLSHWCRIYCKFMFTPNSSTLQN